MRLYDSLSQEKKDFVPRDGDRVTMYFCGPTVYNYVHVGNARPYVVSMVAKRYFESLGYSVTLVENITDIDDRIITKGIKEGRPAADVAAEFAQAYRDDTDRLGLGRPDVEPLATEHVQEIIDLIATLVERGHAYQAGPDVYFDVRSSPDYGKLSKQQVAEMRHGARISVGEDKKDPLDFALWKGAKPGEPAWDSPWGSGRPGWHIECSAMSLKYLGAGFDIHGGGRDLIFPHHENEIAQSEGAVGAPYVRFWMHNGMLNLSEQKMSKSVGNILTLRATLDKHRPEALIAVFLASHYRSPMEFGEDVLEEAEQQVDRLKNVFGELADRAAGCAPAAPDAAPGDSETPDAALLDRLGARRHAFMDALADDLNTAAALAEIFGAAREVNAALAAGDLDAGTAARVRAGMLEMVHVLGLDAVAGGDAAIPEDVVCMAEERQECRVARDFARADELRAALAERGYEVRDVPGGFKVVCTR
ncbi:MAG: cysteine--tRNA ligase [Actinobacteria bacterium RBG_16_64_13]|nr:MAG: cysteine--tRNA ligase [Actinobacteria bacterium RBG_16_64_13]